ncbi:Fanconi anemia group I protein-like [Ostrea edulis]|uniref:Fanconi anemia group I protein-like n=1 Tax=Ostrea edulis TaxID=37623 RepID=UPI0024AEA441|nr:Fanconi anemia group I protein-like [Ostrea edulis]XP_056004227.1 Fanconi anemia group I protein-like [Ostrea edulis]
MDSLIDKAEDGNVDDVAEMLCKVQNKEVIDTIEKRLRREKGDAVSVIRTVLQASTKATGGRKIGVSLCKRLIETLERNELSSKLASNLTGMLLTEIDILHSSALAEISSVFVDMVKSGAIQCGKGLALLPKILSALALEETVSYGESCLNGEQYKNHVINSVCSCKWNTQSVLHLAAMFKDITLTSEELKFVLEKILRMMRELELADLPALVYQLLLLSTKGHKKLVIDGVTKYFIEQDAKYKDHDPNEFSEDLLEGDNFSIETLRQTEGTIILHLNFAISMDQELGREFIKFLKGNQSDTSKVLAPFVLALSLSLSRIHRFEGQIFDLLKATVIKNFKDSEKQKQSKWVREMVPDSCEVQDSVLSTIQNSKHGWDHVIQGLVQLGFGLMDACGPKGAFGRIETGSVQNGPTHSTCMLGSKILLHTFKTHDLVRAEILEQIFNRVVTKATSPVSHYLELLSSTVMSAPQRLLESSTKVREVFDYLAFLLPSTAEELLKAIHPLLKLSMSLRDSLILVLRKAMFSRQLDSRKIGVYGFLMFLKNFRILGGLPSSQASQSFSSSQVQVDVHTRYNPASNEALCLEVMGNLRRVLTQQADVRLMFYQGIYEALCKNTQILGTVLEILLYQLKKYYEPTEDVNPPVKLNLCITAQGDQMYLAEPLAHLICCIQLCLIKVSDIRRHQDGDHDDTVTEDSNQTQQELEDMMDSLVTRMIKSEMEDFELDKSADYSLATSVGTKNNIFSILVLGMYESLMEYTFNTGQYSESSLRQTLQLYDNYKKLSDVLKEKASSAAGKKGKVPTGHKTALSLLSIRSTTEILRALISETAPSLTENLTILRENTDFRRHIVNVALQKIQQIQEKGVCDGAEGGDRTKLLQHLINMAKIFITYYTENQRMEEDGKRDKSKYISGPCLEGLMGIMTIISQRYSDQFCHCLCEMVRSDESEDPQEDIYRHIKKYQRLVMNILISDAEDKNMKEVQLLLGVIQILCKQLYGTGSQFEMVLDWIHKLCSEQSIDDIPTCKLLFSMLMAFTQQVKSCPPLLRDLSQDIHSQLGDIDQETEVEDKTHFSLVTPRTAAPILLNLVLQQTERELDDTDWVVARLRGEAGQASDEEEIDLTQKEGHERSICTRLGILVTAFHELVQSAIPVGACMENMVKQATRLYGTLTVLVKYYLNLYQQRTGHLSSRFEKLVKLIGTHLTQHCYGMITYIQQTESEQMQQTVDKKKKDRKKQAAALNAGKVRFMKESRTIPNLIFSIETLEKFLIQLTKKSKVNLMEHMKMSTSRDFRINVATVQAVMENDSGSSEEEEEENNGNEEDQDNEEDESEERENTVPANKRPPEPLDPPPTKKFKLGKKARSDVV